MSARSHLEKNNHRNDSGVKNSDDCYRTFDGRHYVNWTSGWLPEIMKAVTAGLRRHGVQCRRIGADLFVLHSDMDKAAQAQQEFPMECDPQHLAEQVIK